MKTKSQEQTKIFKERFQNIKLRLKNRFDEDGLIYEFEKKFHFNKQTLFVHFWFKDKDGDGVIVQVYDPNRKKKRTRKNDILKNVYNQKILYFSTKQVKYKLDEIVEEIYSCNPNFIDDNIIIP
jgi:hypothetical protein